MNAKLLGQLFLTFAKVGVMTFGGGMAMLPILQREVVEDKGWATDEELVDYFAIGQCTPGIIAVNTATFIGQKQAGIIVYGQRRGLPDGIASQDAHGPAQIHAPPPVFRQPFHWVGQHSPQGCQLGQYGVCQRVRRHVKLL